MNDVERLRQQNHEAAAKRDRDIARMQSELDRYRNAYKRARELVRGSPVDWTKDPPASKPDGWWNYTSQQNRDIIAAAVLDAQEPPRTPDDLRMMREVRDDSLYKKENA